MRDFVYYPVVKTRDAELRCFSNIDDKCFDKILPIYELTKSRKTKKAPDGDIYRRMQQVGEIQGGRPFVLDLSTDPRYVNSQIEQLLSESHGFKDWEYFVFDLHGDLNIIPMVHIYEDDLGVSENVNRFVEVASRKSGFLAVRLPCELGRDKVEHYLEPIVSSLEDGCKLYVFIDGGFVRDKIDGDLVDDVVDAFVDSCSGVERFHEKIEKVVVLSTTFPSSPANEGRGDAEGSFRIYEEDIFKGVSEEVFVGYGDYASINTEQVEIKGGTFVPRIDVASQDGRSFSYKRCRRAQGGYHVCAKKVIMDKKVYTPLGTWADNEIQLAANGMPSGLSPAFWISVRMNYYIKTRVSLREGFLE